MTRPVPTRQRGFALVSAVFLLVVIAALGAFAVRVNSNQQHSADLDLAMLRADAAVQSGIQYAAARLSVTNACNPGLDGQSLLLPQGYNVILECDSPNPAQVVNGVAVNVFLLTATATRGQYGSPEFVSRQRTVRITP
jgi:MSHA biogenesis protein MshP